MRFGLILLIAIGLYAIGLRDWRLIPAMVVLVLLGRFREGLSK